MVKTDAAKVMFAGEADGFIEGRVTDQANEVAIRSGDILEQVDVGGNFGYATLSTLGGW